MPTAARSMCSPGGCTESSSVTRRSRRRSLHKTPSPGIKAGQTMIQILGYPSLRMTRVPFRLILARICLKICSGTTLALLFVAGAPALVQAGECPTSASEIATDRPDVTNSSLVVPVGSLQGENGINTTRRGLGQDVRRNQQPAAARRRQLPGDSGRHAELCRPPERRRRHWLWQCGAGDQVAILFASRNPGICR